MITRTLGKIVRGTATPLQLFLACLLAAMLGFIPGFSHAPGLVVTLLLALVVFNANLGLAALVALGAKLPSLLLTPITFKVGQFLLDGPTQSWMRSLINAPVLAWFGFEYYLTSGALIMGTLVGVVTGCLVVKSINGFRRKMAALDSNSEAFKKFTSKPMVKLATYIFVGGGIGKQSYQDLLARKFGNPFRTLGLVFAALAIVLLFILQQFAANPIVYMAVQRGLEGVNGATVDLGDVNADLKQNKLILTDLALADANQLDTDLFRAETIEADLSGMSLLKKRLEIDRLVLRNASQGQKRALPGKRIGPAPEPTPPPSPSDSDPVKTIDDYLKDAKVWKERLAQAKEWLDKLAGPSEEETEGAVAPGEQAETWSERLAREVREKGYANVRAGHLIAGSPTLTITELRGEAVTTTALPGETLDIVGTNLSTHPKLLGKAPEITVRSSKQTLDIDLALAEISGAGSSNRLALSYRGLETDTVAGQLKLGNQSNLQGGTIDLTMDGQWSASKGVAVDLPVQATLKNTTLSIPGSPATQVDHFVLPMRLSGPLDNPRVRVDDAGLRDALVKAGLSKATTLLKEKGQEQINEVVGDKVGDSGKKLLDSILGGKKEEKK